MYIPIETEMKHISNLQDFLELVIYSAYIEGERPLSTMIIAEPESGKTELMKKYASADKPKDIINGLLPFNDVTAWGIQTYYLPLIQRGIVRHIVIYDMTVPMARKATTVKTFIGFFNGLIEEGVARIATYGTRVPVEMPDVRCGLIAGITPGDMRDKRHVWTRKGFMTRTIPWSYTYSLKAVRDIIDSIVEREYVTNFIKHIPIKLPKEDRKIELPIKHARMLKKVRDRIAEKAGIYGFRLQKHLQVLAMSSALRENRDIVEVEDVGRVLRLSNWINFEGRCFK